MRRWKASMRSPRDAGSDQAVLDFSVVLRRERIAARMTQEELARRAGVSVRAIQSLERGDRRPYRETTNRLTSALGLEGVAEATFLRTARPAPRVSANGARGKSAEAVARPPANNVPVQ